MFDSCSGQKMFPNDPENLNFKLKWKNLYRIIWFEAQEKFHQIYHKKKKKKLFDSFGQKGVVFITSFTSSSSDIFSAERQVIIIITKRLNNEKKKLFWTKTRGNKARTRLNHFCDGKTLEKTPPKWSKLLRKETDEEADLSTLLWTAALRIPAMLRMGLRVVSETVQWLFIGLQRIKPMSVIHPLSISCLKTLCFDIYLVQYGTFRPQLKY